MDFSSMIARLFFIVMAFIYHFRTLEQTLYSGNDRVWMLYIPIRLSLIYNNRRQELLIQWQLLLEEFSYNRDSMKTIRYVN